MSALIILGVVLPWLLVAVGCWIGFQLMRQNGRLLLHLENIERQLMQVMTGAGASARAPHAVPSLPVGSEAPDFELPDLLGTNRRLSDYKGRRVLLVFFSPHCGHCVQMAPDLAALPLGDPLPIVVSSGSVEDNKRFVEEHHIIGPVLLQQGNEVGGGYQSSGTPMGYLIDAEGKIASPLAAGAQAILALTTQASPSGNGKGSAQHKPLPGARSLSESRILRTGLPTGTPAPDFTLSRVDGGSLSLTEYRGRRVLLVLSSADCGPCNMLAPKLEAAYRESHDPAIVMVSRGGLEENRRKVAEYGLTFPVAVQQQWEVSRTYGMFGTPAAFLVDERGTVASDVAQGVEAILALHGRAQNLQPEEVTT